MKYRLLSLAMILAFYTNTNSQSKIGKAEESLKKTNSNTVQTQNHKEPESIYTGRVANSENNYVSDFAGGFIVQLFAYTAYGIAFESPFEMNHQGSRAFLTKYPYQNADIGNYSYNWNEDTELFTTTISSRYVFETNKIQGNHLNLQMRFLKRVGLELDYLQLWEKNQNFGNDALAIYTALAKYHRVRTERFDAYWGLGAAYVDGAVNQLGFTYALGAELFFAKPLSLETNFSQTLINGNSINKWNALLNYHKKRYKFTGGYEYLKIGSEGFSTVTIGVGTSL